MDFFKKIKDFNTQINNLESGIYLGEKRYREIYERNQKLESEIKKRTQDLEIANRQMLTLQHILDMLTAAKPLSGVLKAIVNSLQGELGYLHASIIKHYKEKDLQYLEVIAHSDDEFSAKISETLEIPIYKSKTKYTPSKGYEEYTKLNQICQFNDFSELLNKFFTNINSQPIVNHMREISCNSCITIPLTADKKHYGSLIILSSREEAKEEELRFLSMFAKQIEVAITISSLFQAVKSQAVCDALTGLYNRRYFEDFIKKEALRANRQNQKFSVIGLDLDFLKQINDNYGHNYGDIAIKTIAEVLKSNARSIDVAARIGGEEFNILLPGIDSEGAMIAAERIRKAIEAQEIPVIGKITAGAPILAVENITDTFPIPIDFVGNSESFMLTVRGESMIEAGILDGDYILVKKQNTARNGEIVVALIEDEATVKTFYKEKDHIRLQPENSTMDPIIVPDCKILGKVGGVFRKI